MEVQKLERGVAAPIDADCISIDTRAGGGVSLSGTALCEGDSVALVGMPFDSAEEAEQQGLAWAAAQGVELLYVTYDAPFPGD